jgi:hypothetical protein
VANIHAKHRGTGHQSTIGRLQNALAPENNYKQFIGEVNYIDKKHPFDDMFFRFYSRKSFQYEREVRIISDVAESNITLNDGLKINVDIDQLTNNLHSKSENWYKTWSSS